MVTLVTGFYAETKLVADLDRAGGGAATARMRAALLAVPGGNLDFDVELAPTVPHAGARSRGFYLRFLRAA